MVGEVTKHSEAAEGGPEANVRHLIFELLRWSLCDEVLGGSAGEAAEGAPYR